MTAAAWTFYLISVMLGHNRLEQLGRPYPATTSLLLMSAGMAMFLLLDGLLSP